MTMRGVLLFGHIIGFVLWFGLSFTLALMTVRAKKTGDRSVVAFAYRTSHDLLKGPGLVGILVTMICGFGLTGVGGYGPELNRGGTLITLKSKDDFDLMTVFPDGSTWRHSDPLGD